jgi:hypothetical protein
MSISTPASDLNRTTIYKQLATGHIAAFIRSQKTAALAISAEYAHRPRGIVLVMLAFTSSNCSLVQSRVSKIDVSV